MLLVSEHWHHPAAAEKPKVKEMTVRFRTIGDMTCTGAVESTASTMDEIIAEVAAAAPDRARHPRG
jgi:3'-phosphoadenosine 5'-phosphosulfate sulfotransferase (PAPS reductase)/FAD synthetase